MKLAILSDIHANQVALRKVLEEVERLKIDKIYVLGDMIGYYYHPDEVFCLLEAYDTSFINGNHERMLLKCLEDPLFLKNIDKVYASGMHYAIRNLKKSTIKKIENYPEQIITCIEGVKIAFCHGALNAPDRYLYSDTEKAVLDQFVDESLDFIFIGHTHYPFMFLKNKTIMANVGSVGQARDKGGIASWCVLDLSNRTLIFKHTVYNTASIILEVKTVDLGNVYLHEVLER